VWREHATTDLARSTAFYGELFGWKHKDSDMGEMGVYRQFEVGGKTIAGCYKLGPQMVGVPPHWVQYISVSDVDAAATRAKANGGQVMMGPMDIPNVGRAVYVRDPQGATIALFKDLKGDEPPGEGRPALGTFCWESLITTDKKGAAAFYTKVVDGLSVGDFNGNMTLSRGKGPMDGVADLGEAPPGVPAHWVSHIVVANLKESRDRAQKLGAKILMAEIVVPTVGKIAFVNDPVGAVVSLFEPEPPK